MNKTFNKKDVFSWSNAENAEKYIGKEGYFSDDYSTNLTDWTKDILLYIHKDRKIDEIFESANHLRGLFLPADKVKEVKEEKKWRAFKDLDDLKTYGNKSVGSVIVFRKKNKDDTITTSVITSYIFKTNCICIGNQPFLFETLFQEYELLNEHAIWQPFGVEE